MLHKLFSTLEANLQQFRMGKKRNLTSIRVEGSLPVHVASQFRRNLLVRIRSNAIMRIEVYADQVHSNSRRRWLRPIWDRPGISPIFFFSCPRGNATPRSRRPSVPSGVEACQKYRPVFRRLNFEEVDQLWPGTNQLKFVPSVILPIAQHRSSRE